jgi:hypothetical protein
LEPAGGGDDDRAIGARRTQVHDTADMVAPSPGEKLGGFGPVPRRRDVGGPGWPLLHRAARCRRNRRQREHRDPRSGAHRVRSSAAPGPNAAESAALV